MSIRHYLTFNIMSDSTLITFYIISIHHYFPLNVMSHSASIQPYVLSSSFPVRRLFLPTFLPFDVLLSTFCPIGHTSNLMSSHHYFSCVTSSPSEFFFTIQYSSDDLLSHLTLCALTFYTVGIFYFDILSVNQILQ